MPSSLIAAPEMELDGELLSVVGDDARLVSEHAEQAIDGRSSERRKLHRGRPQLHARPLAV